MPNAQPPPLLVLASASPRRRYLLQQAGLVFAVCPSQVDEGSIAADSPFEYAFRTAEAKALEVADKFPQSWVIGADTIVVVGEEVLGKPHSDAMARRMLKKLSGKVHRVMTGCAILSKRHREAYRETIVTDVRFKSLCDAEIEWYIGTREPFDKAGAYAIQGMGTFLVKSIDGSYTNVVGLPVCEVVEYLISIGVAEQCRRAPGKMEKKGPE